MRIPDACHSDSPNGICCPGHRSVTAHECWRTQRVACIRGQAEAFETGELTGFAFEKKSMSFPMVNGTLIDTALDTMSKPIAIPSGFFSGTASETILRNDDAVLAESCVSAGRNRFHMDVFGGGGVGGLLCVAGVAGGEGDDKGVSDGGEKAGLDDAKCLRPSRRVSRTLGAGRGHGGLETCRASRAAVRAGGRSVGATKTRARSASIVVGVVVVVVVVYSVRGGRRMSLRIAPATEFARHARTGARGASPLPRETCRHASWPRRAAGTGRARDDW